MLNLVIVEDNAALRESLVDVLAADDHHVVAFESAEGFLANCSIATVDILLLDLNLPGEDGMSLARRMRAEWPDLGIVMLTARGAPTDRSDGYESGADIYLTKPSSAPELTASIRALARRLSKEARGAVTASAEATLPLVLNRKTMTLTGPEGAQALTSSETDLLEAFVKAADNRLDLDSILRLGPVSVPVSKAALGVKIVRLRKKLTAVGAEGQSLNVVRNWGYQLSVAITLI
jgi:DNA-binding response OmpR family regulator